ncbi:hypothetical protein LX32DRAFT_222894 [Colletotrichum zoysiae]|uniref:Uncharacterized protein n=1 Tax=Colletotrichum zoysiae TaxID=1216348 RepID=A0AAD9H3Y8_9PEZI|nr:hypothetical protein LX32DRAFT_222894 [Colletotrichum zoysiae]
MPCNWKLHNGPATTAAISLNKVILRSPTQLHKFKSSAEYPEAGWLDGSGPEEAGYTLLVFLGAVPRMAGKVVCACRRLERPLAATLRIANDQKTSCQGVPAVALGTPVVLGPKMQTTVPCRWTWQPVDRQACLCAPPTRHGIPSSVLPIPAGKYLPPPKVQGPTSQAKRPQNIPFPTTMRRNVGLWPSHRFAIRKQWRISERPL